MAIPDSPRPVSGSSRSSCAALPSPSSQPFRRAAAVESTNALSVGRQRAELARHATLGAQPVLLVIVLGPAEAVERLEHRRDPPGPRAYHVRRVLGRSALVVVHEDRRPALPGVGGRARVVTGPEHREQVLVAHGVGVVVDLDRLGVAARPMVGRVGSRAPGIPDARADDAIQTPEPGVGAPESTEGEGGGEHVGVRLGIERNEPGL